MSPADWNLQISGLSTHCAIEGGWGALTGLTPRAADLVAAGARVFLVSDRSVWKRWEHHISAPLLLAGVRPDVFLIEAGELSKTIERATAIWSWLTDLGCRRTDVILAAGGGVVGDLAGFAAATYLRGVRLWQVPTTLLAQVDSSVGGKVAVNLPSGKNLVGSFYQPEVVVADQEFLATLAPKELSSGLGEVVKCALLSGAPFFSYLEQCAERLWALEPDALSTVVEHCIRLKAEVVTEDERDTGRRAVLNLGHTIGHAIEVAVGFGNISHGAAVGLGLLAALRVSEMRCALDAALLPRVRSLLERFGLPVTVRGVDPDAVLAAVTRDKKTTSEGLGFVCLRDVGAPEWGVGVTRETLESGLEVILG